MAESTRRLLGDLFELDDLGQQALKGIAQPVAAFAIGAERALESRFEARQGNRLARMVGRDQELALLTERWRQAKGGEGQLVLLTGEAGIGKSRITRALIDAVAADVHIRINYQCSPYHVDSPLYPTIQQLSRAAGFAADDTIKARFDKLEALLGRAGEPLDEAAPLIGMLLGLETEARYGKLDLSPQQQRTRTLRALVDQTLGLARQQPVLFVLEDAHWIDPTTLEMVQVALDAIAGDRVLILLTSRPDNQPEIAGHPHVTRFTLNRLGAGQITAIVDRLTGGKALPGALVDEIAAKTDGVPLFVEELTKTVLESGMLRETDDAYVLDRPLSALAIPTSLHDSLMARLDRLQPVKEVAQTAACIGRDFSHALLAKVSPRSEADLQEALDRLIAAELIFRRGQPPDATYTFKHALVRDAAHESLLKSKRQQLHAGVVQALEDQGAAPEILASHAVEAGHIDKAIDYWQEAGESALARPAYREAMGHFGNAINLVGDPVDDRQSQARKLQLLTQLGLASIASRGHSHPATTDIFETACLLADAVGDPTLSMPCLYGAWTVHHVTPHHDLALERARQLANIASRIGEQTYEFLGHRVVATSQFMVGALSEAHAAHDRALAIHDPERDSTLATVVGQDQSISFSTYYAFNLWCLGHTEQACKPAEDALALSRKTGHANSRVYGLLHHLIFMALAGRRPSVARELCRETAEAAAEHSMGMWHSFTLIVDGSLQLAGDDPDDAVTRLRAAIASMAARNAHVFRPFLDADCARKLAVLGRIGDAREFVTSAKTIMAASEERWAEAEVHRVDGLVHRAEGHPDEAEQAFRQAIEIARRQHAKAWELRAATSLARLWADRGERDKASDLLAPVYDWFTEGFDEPDLRDAKALLDALN